jgi:EpsI family protein
MKSPRFLVVVLLLVATLVVLYRRGDVDSVPPSTPLAEMPMTFGPWSGTEYPLDQETLDVLGKGVFLNRTYVPTEPSMGTAPVSLFIGYFPTQRSGQSIHSPQHCLPGAGWVFDSSGTTALAGPAGKPIEVGEYVISNGPAKDEVLYWYQSQGKAIAGDYKAKLYMLANSIRSNRTDAALVRVITPVREGESQAAAHQRAVGFAEKFVPLLPRYIPD